MQAVLDHLDWLFYGGLFVALFCDSPSSKYTGLGFIAIAVGAALYLGGRP